VVECYVELGCELVGLFVDCGFDVLFWMWMEGVGEGIIGVWVWCMVHEVFVYCVDA